MKSDLELYFRIDYAKFVLLLFSKLIFILDSQSTNSFNMKIHMNIHINIG